MKLDDVKKLHQKKYRTRLGHYLVEGEHLLLELEKALAVQPDAPHITVYVTEDHEWLGRKLSGPFSVQVVSEKQMTQLSDTKSPQGIVACVPLPAKPLVADNVKKERAVYLHEVQDPGNLGTIMRSLAWFGGFRLLLSPNSVDPFNSKVVRASMGAIFHLPVEIDVPLDTLKTRFNEFAYLDLQGEPVQSDAFGQFDCYLFGNEARGVPADTLRQFSASPFTIAGCGAIDSLNLASTVSMCAFQLSGAR